MTNLLFNNVLVTVAKKGNIATIKRYADGILNTEIKKNLQEAEIIVSKLLNAGYINE